MGGLLACRHTAWFSTLSLPLVVKARRRWAAKRSTKVRRYNQVPVGVGEGLLLRVDVETC